ncbi:hypothetical protein, partial [Rhizobium ruizarguesonis]|uniref:hypothetical protein n=1 Tax=Rhizobium ruizarguesonis TaxID=2081791 RepID=UPI001953FE43
MPMPLRFTAPSRPQFRLPRPAATMAVAAAALLAGCAGVPNSMPGLDRSARFDPDDFNTSASIYTRHIDAPPARVCEGARRALLSQGYL